MPFLRSFAVLTTLLTGAVGTFISPADPALADSDTANVVIEVTANRNILSRFGESTVGVSVRNDGSVPASGVTVTITLPPELILFEQLSTYLWRCDAATPVTTCTFTGDLAPGQSQIVVSDRVRVDPGRTGIVVEAGAVATTSTPESSTVDNSAYRQFHIVDTGMIRGLVWNDLNADGIRQANEPTETSVPLSISSQDDEDNYTAFSGLDGAYAYELPSKRFKITTEASLYNWRFTKPDVGDDDTDSDLRVVAENSYSQTAESPVFLVDPAKESHFDVGLVATFRPDRISPAFGLRGTTAVVTFTGVKFASDLTVQLTRAGFDPIPGTIESVAADQTSMTVSFPLTTAAGGKWTVSLDRQFGAYAEVVDAFTVSLPPLRSTAGPSISGTVAVGSTVKAVPGVWTPAATSYTYQWLANGVAIAGATAPSMTIPAAMLGARLTVKVTALRTGYTPASASSAPWAGFVKPKA